MSENEFKILVINPGSTSTMVSVFENEKELFGTSITHSRLELERFEKIWDQYEFRKRLIKELLDDNNVKPADLSAVVGRGGLFRPVVGGTYRVNQLMIEDGRRASRGEHASNLGAVLAYGLGWDFDLPSFIVDPPSVDEFIPPARVSGLKEVPRESLFHALNIKATARKAAAEIGIEFEKSNFVIAHLGGGISVAAIRRGKVVDCNNALTSGPFTPERAGDISTFALVDICFSERYDKKQIKRMLVGRGGLSSHLNTNNCREVEKRITGGDKEAERVYEAMIFSICANIGARAVALNGDIDAVILTGGMASSDYVVKRIDEWVSFLGRILVFPGQNEMEALALGALRILRGEEQPKEYPETVE